MRDLEFRAWHPESKEMVYFDAEQASRDELIACHFFELMAGIHQTGQSLQQYTGLTDANGVKRYEGDIIGFKWGIGVIRWSDKTNGFIVSPNKGMFYDYSIVGLGEVIGNIYENPELLTSKN